MAIWKASEFDEVSLIRSIVTAPEFHEKSSQEGFVVTSDMSLAVWKKSVLAALNITEEKDIPPLRDGSFLQKSLFLEALLSQIRPGSKASGLGNHLAARTWPENISEGKGCSQWAECQGHLSLALFI